MRRFWNTWIWRRRSVPYAFFCLWLEYLLLFVLFCLSYRVPGMADLSEEHERAFRTMFEPLEFTFQWRPILWLANGFSNAVTFLGTTPVWIYAFLGVAVVSAYFNWEFIRSFEISPAVPRQPNHRTPEVSSGKPSRRHWRVAWMALVLVAPYIGFRIYVPLYVRHYAEAVLNPAIYYDTHTYGIMAEHLSAYPDEAIDYLVNAHTPEDPVRSELASSLLTYGVSSWWTRPDYDPDLERKFPFHGKGDMVSRTAPPEEVARKCRAIKDWWARYTRP